MLTSYVEQQPVTASDGPPGLTIHQILKNRQPRILIAEKREELHGLWDADPPLSRVSLCHKVLATLEPGGDRAAHGVGNGAEELQFINGCHTVMDDALKACGQESLFYAWASAFQCGECPLKGCCTTFDRGEKGYLGIWFLQHQGTPCKRHLCLGLITVTDPCHGA